MVFAFLTKHVDDDNTLGVYEAYASSKLLKLLSRQTERHLRSMRIGVRFGEVPCWLKVVNHFHSTYATAAAIHNAFSNLM